MALFLLGLNTKILSQESRCALEEAIATKTEQIATTQAADHDELAQLYTTRGEFYIFHSQYQQALDDFQTAYLHSQHIIDYQTALFCAFQSLFGSTICYDNMEAYDNVEESIQHLHSIVDSMQCENCMKGSSTAIAKSTSPFLHSNPLMSLCSNRRGDYSDIIGPDEVPSGWCAASVENTADKIREMIPKSPTLRTRQTLLHIVKRMETEAYNCCRKGGFWKSCVAPMARKWKEWKDFEEKFGYPPLP